MGEAVRIRRLGPAPVFLPEFKTFPYITGTPQQGEILTVNYTAEHATTIDHQWYRADDQAGTNATVIAGATNTTYTLQAADVNYYVSCMITLYNAAGTVQGQTSYVGAVIAPPAPALDFYVNQLATFETQPAINGEGADASTNVTLNVYRSSDSSLQSGPHTVTANSSGYFTLPAGTMNALAVDQYYVVSDGTAGGGPESHTSDLFVIQQIVPYGGITARPPETGVPMTVTNPGFETGDLTGWKQTELRFLVSSAEARTGTYSLKYDASIVHQYTRYFDSDPFTTSPAGYRWVASCWYKASGFTPGRGLRFGITISGSTAVKWSPVLKNATDWTLVEVESRVESSATYPTLRLCVGEYAPDGNGVAYFDDFSVARYRIDCDVRPKVVYPNWRGYLAEDRSQTIRVQVEALSPGTLTVFDSNQQQIGNIVPISVGTAEYQIDATAWAVGEYRLRASDGTNDYPDYIIQKITQATRESMRVWYESDGRMLLNNSPHLVLGLYDVGGYSTSVNWWLDSCNGARGGMRFMAQGSGMGAYLNYWLEGADANSLSAMYSAMQTVGTENGYVGGISHVVIDYFVGYSAYPIPISAYTPNASFPTTRQDQIDTFNAVYASFWRQKTNLLSWYAEDEPKTAEWEVDQMWQKYRVFREFAPDIPFFSVFLGSSGVGLTAAYYYDYNDVFGTDPYPLIAYQANYDPITDCYNEMKLLADGVPGRPLQCVHQAWKWYSTDPWPTAQEQLVMLYASIVAGARGFWWWSFGSSSAGQALGSLNATDFAIQWPPVRDAMAEARALEDAILAPDETGYVTNCDDPAVIWVERLVGSTLHVFACKPGTDHRQRLSPPTTITFTIPTATPSTSIQRDMTFDDAVHFSTTVT